MAKSTQEPRFEQMLLELEGIVSKMEQGGLALEETLALYEKGAALEKKLEKQLTDSKRRITLLTGQENTEVPFEEDMQ